VSRGRGQAGGKPAPLVGAPSGMWGEWGRHGRDARATRGGEGDTGGTPVPQDLGYVVRMAKRSDGTKSGFDAAEVAGLGYEAAVERLEGIIEAIESGEVGLEASIAKYEEGAALLARCRAILGQSEQKIEALEARVMGGDADAPAGGGVG